jgi:hypothetical protein
MDMEVLCHLTLHSLKLSEVILVNTVSLLGKWNDLLGAAFFAKPIMEYILNHLLIERVYSILN